MKESEDQVGAPPGTECGVQTHVPEMVDKGVQVSMRELESCHLCYKMEHRYLNEAYQMGILALLQLIHFYMFVHYC